MPSRGEAMPQFTPIQESYFSLLKELTQEEDSFLRGVGRSHYYLDHMGERLEVTRAEWRTITTDRANQLALNCQVPEQEVTLDVPPGSI